MNKVIQKSKHPFYNIFKCMVTSRQILFKVVTKTTDMVRISQYQKQQSLCETKLH